MLKLAFLLLLVIQQGNDNLDKRSVAIEGYDPVSYFTNKPLVGNEAIQSSFNGAKYYFANAKNRDLFEKNPEKYAPQFGGWCAYALGLGPDKVKIDPETYKIVDSKLYLFYNFKGVNTLDLWNEKEATLLPEAFKNWQVIINK